MNKIEFGDCREIMKRWINEGVKVQTCITSPPYYGLRDYGVDGQIGLEQSVDDYVNNMVEVFRFVKDILSDDGTLWLKGLPLLKPTNIVDKGEFVTFKSGKRMTKWYADAAKLSPKEREKARNKTFQGIADAMANQWGNL